MKALSRSAMSAASLISSPALRNGSPWMVCAKASPKPVEPL